LGKLKNLEADLDGVHSITQGGESPKKEIVGPSADMPRSQHQLSILKSFGERFESSLFDIKQLVRADVFDSEVMLQENY